MRVRKKTLLNVLLIGFVLSFFVTPLGQYSKLWLMELFSFSPRIVNVEDRRQLATYDWQLKDADWNFFNFEQARGKVVLINFWASWRLPCLPELGSLQELYERYGDRVSFYIITDEERAPVELFMEENGFTFPVTYRIIGEPSPVDPEDAPRSYLIDKNGFVVIDEQGISDWDTRRVHELLDSLLAE